MLIKNISNKPFVYENISIEPETIIELPDSQARIILSMFYSTDLIPIYEDKKI